MWFLIASNSSLTICSDSRKGLGNANAQCNLGLMYHEGLGVAQDYKEAVKWWRLAAEQREEQAQINLAAMQDDDLDYLISSN